MSAVALSLLTAIGPQVTADGGQLTAETVAAFCAPERAFGIAFGSPEAPGLHMSVVSSLIDLPSAYAPFGAAEVAVTMKGRRRHTIHAQADFETERAANQMLATVRDALLKEGWSADAAPEGRPQSFHSRPDTKDARRPKGQIAELFTLGSRLYFSCSDAGWKRKAEQELPPRPPQAPR